MTQEQLTAFITDAKGDVSLQAKLKAATDADAVLAIAKEAGYVFTAEDFKKTEETISAEDLEMAAGGRGHSVRSTHIYNAAGFCNTKSEIFPH
jgi:predicted ribosomally synthesized peptide with nif11-like leader